jgi:competence protein ComEA
MTIFTKQEQRFLLFLVITFFIGLGIKIVRMNLQDEPDEAWANERQQILAEFNEKSAMLLKEDSTLAVTKKNNSITKKSLTTKININSANAEELQLLPRIGPTLAENIVTYREAHGPFKTIDDIQNVKRIGPKTFEKLKLYITVE